MLLHEQTHIRRGDPLTKPLFYAVACLHWFNPLAWLAFCTFERDMEAACDEAAVRGRPRPSATPTVRAFCILPCRAAAYRAAWLSARAA